MPSPGRSSTERPVVGSAAPSTTISVRTSPGQIDTTATPSGRAARGACRPSSCRAPPCRRRSRTLCAYWTAPDDEMFTMRPAARLEQHRRGDDRGDVVRAHTDPDDLLPRRDGHLPEGLAEPRREVDRRVHVVDEHVEAPVLARAPGRTAPRPRRRRGGRRRRRSPHPPAPRSRRRSRPPCPGSGPARRSAR